MDGVLLGESTGRETAMTIGVFDGIHRGHQILIEKIVQQGPACISTVVTFNQNPKKVLRPREYQGDIVGLDRKMIIFETLGVELVILIDFSQEFSKLDGRDFIEYLKSRGRLALLAIGSNFRCGYGLDTDASDIQKINRRTEVVSPVMEGGIPVSSSRIRGAVSVGDLDKAALLLGRKVEIDLIGLSPRPQPDGLFYDARSCYRILPPSGRYIVICYEFHKSGGKKTEMLIQDGGVFIPSLNLVERVEFIQ
jgi:riboflavin kinase/FMN adenylyltransferase